MHEHNKTQTWEIPAAEHKARHAPLQPATQRRHFVRNLIWIFVALLAALWVYRFIQSKQSASKPQAGAGNFPVPVVAGKVEIKDVPIYLDGLGTVQALNTVTVRTRVDGQITKVAFVEGQDVRAGDLLVQIDDAPFKASYDQAVAKEAQDQAQLSNARLDMARDEDLLARKVISQQQYDTQKALVNQLDAAVKTDAAAIQSAKVQLDYTRIVSPIDGRTGIRLIDPGNVVHTTDTNGLVVITQLQPIAMVFTLPEQNLGDIHKHTTATGDLSVLAVDRDNKTVLDTGRLAVIDNQIDTTTGTIKLKAIFPNKNFQLWPGQFVNARLLLTVRKNATVVPASVVQRGPQGPYAFVIKSDDTVEIRPLKVALIEQNDAVIDEGLQPGERVVVDGQYKLQPGAKVKIGEGKPGGSAGKGGAQKNRAGKPTM